jgi:hypothetical protein
VTDELITGEFHAGDSGVRIGPLTGPQDPIPAAINLILDVLRANHLHQQACTHRQIAEAQARSDMYLVQKPCDCWLSG